jgi:hypothetical protein
MFLRRMNLNVEYFRSLAKDAAPIATIFTAQEMINLNKGKVNNQSVLPKWKKQLYECQLHKPGGCKVR